MAEGTLPRSWGYRALFALMAAAIVFVQVLPLDIRAGRWPGPDLILALAFAWALRRPDFLPPLLAGAVLLTADLILQRPPGLWAGLVVLALEMIRARRALWRDLPFAAEWVVVAVLMALVILAYWLVLALFMIDQPALGLYLIQLIATAAAYPLVVAVSAGVFGVRKPAPGAVDALGHRL